MYKIKNAAILKLSLASMLLLSACGDENSDGVQNQTIIRGLKTTVVKEQERSTERKYPSVLQPSTISSLSFEIAGNLSEFKLDVGQVVRKGEILATIDSVNLELQVEGTQAALRQAKAETQTAIQDFERKDALLKKGVVTRAVADAAMNTAESAKEALVQAKKQLETAKLNLTKTELKAPFDGIINSVEVNSFANVSAGTSIATLYSSESFEASFSVSYDVIKQLAIGKKAVVRLADNPAVKLDAQVSELGARADVVSSFPAVVKIDNTNTSLKAGMAVEISVEFAVQNGKGYILPLTALALEGNIQKPESNSDPREAFVYVFDEDTSTVKRRAVQIAGVRGNSLIIIGGLKLGEHVASAGVSFLRDGQKVKLLPNMVGE